MKRLDILLPLLALAAAAGCATRPATGSATVAVTRVVPSETEIPGRRLPFDPIFLRSQFDVIRSAPVLTPVVLSNDLGAVLDAAYGWHMACPDAAADRAVACLRAWTDLSIWRDTDLIGIEVSVDRTVPGAEALSRKLAFDIARSYRANAIALREAEAKATAAQLQSEIDFLRKRIAESGPGDRRALENRRDQLAKRLEWPGTLVPYAEVAVIGEPALSSTPSPAASAPHAEGAEVSGWAVVFKDCDEIVTSNLYVGMLRDEVIQRLGKPDTIEVRPASNLVHWVKFPAGIPSPTGDVVVLTFDNGNAQIGGETFVFLQSGSNSVEEVIGDVEIPPGVVL